MIDETIWQEILYELFSSIEALDTQNGAILQFMKDRGIASDEDLAPFLEKAANTSNVRSRAARVRVNHLLAGAVKASEISEQKSHEATGSKKDEQVSQQSSDGQRDSEQDRATPESAGQDSRPETEGAPAPQAKGGE